MVLPPVLGVRGLPLQATGRPHGAPGAGGVGHPGAGLSSGELPGPHLAAAGILSPEAVLVVGNGGALRVLGRMSRSVAYFGTTPRREESTPAAAILATQLVLEVMGVWYASALPERFLWYLPVAIVGRLMRLRLANVAEGADLDAHAYLSELLDLHQSFDREAAGPYLARRVGGKKCEAPQAFVYCNTRLWAGRIGLRVGLGDRAHPYSAGVMATSPPPDSG